MTEGNKFYKKHMIEYKVVAWNLKRCFNELINLFYTPEMKKDVTQYWETCLECQLQRCVTESDCDPVKSVTRSDNSMDVVNVDLIGPFKPKSSRGHSYISCLVDQ